MNGLKRLTTNLVRTEWKTKKTPKMGASFGVPSAAPVLAPVRRSRASPGSPFPGSSTTHPKRGQGSLLDASLHCAPKEGRVLLKLPKQAREDDDNVCPGPTTGSV